MPILSGGGGGVGLPLTGGTITGPLIETIAATSAGDTDALAIMQADPPGLPQSVFDIDVTRDGAGNNQAALTMNGAGTGQALISLGGDTFIGLIAMGSTDGFTAGDPTTGATYFSATPAILRFIHTAAPGDGLLANSSCALWFDSTNGAPKLMVKAKQADGTVVAAAIVLA